MSILGVRCMCSVQLGFTWGPDLAENFNGKRFFVCTGVCLLFLAWQPLR